MFWYTSSLFCQFSEEGEKGERILGLCSCCFGTILIGKRKKKNKKHELGVNHRRVFRLRTRNGPYVFGKSGESVISEPRGGVKVQNIPVCCNSVKYSPQQRAPPRTTNLQELVLVLSSHGIKSV